MKTLFGLITMVGLSLGSHAQISLNVQHRVGGGVLDDIKSTEIGANYKLNYRTYASMRMAFIRQTNWISGRSSNKKLLPILGMGRIYRINRFLQIGGEVDLRFNDPASSVFGIRPFGLVGFVPIDLNPKCQLELSTGTPYLLGIGLIFRSE